MPSDYRLQSHSPLGRCPSRFQQSPHNKGLGFGPLALSADWLWRDASRSVAAGWEREDQDASWGLLYRSAAAGLLLLLPHWCHPCITSSPKYPIGPAAHEVIGCARRPLLWAIPGLYLNSRATWSALLQEVVIPPSPLVGRVCPEAGVSRPCLVQACMELIVHVFLFWLTESIHYFSGQTLAIK